MFRIISKGGTAFGTKVYQGDIELTDVRRIVIEPLEVDGLVIATIEVLCELDIEAQDTLVLSGVDLIRRHDTQRELDNLRVEEIYRRREAEARLDIEAHDTSVLSGGDECPEVVAAKILLEALIGKVERMNRGPLCLLLIDSPATVAAIRQVEDCRVLIACLVADCE